MKGIIYSSFDSYQEIEVSLFNDNTKIYDVTAGGGQAMLLPKIMGTGAR